MLNKIIRFFGYAVIYLRTFFHCYSLSLLATGTFLSLVMAITSLITSVPKVMSERFWIVYLLSAIPLSVVFFIKVILTSINGKPLQSSGKIK